MTELQADEDDEVPDLEEVDQQQRELEELQKTKDQKQKEWLDGVINKSGDASENKEEEDQESTRKEMLEIDEALRDEGKVTEAMKKIAKEEITDRMESAAEAINGSQVNQTDYDELD